MLSKINLSTVLRLFQVSFILLVSFTPEAFAFTTADDSYLPDDREDKLFLENIIWIILIGVLMFVAATALFGFGDVIASLYGSLQDARKNGEWAAFLRTLAISLAVILVVFFLATLVFGLITDGLSFNPTVTVGS